MINETFILNTSLYTVKFIDVMEAKYSDNIIVENIGSMAKDEGVVQGRG